MPALGVAGAFAHFAALVSLVGCGGPPAPTPVAPAPSPARTTVVGIEKPLPAAPPALEPPMRFLALPSAPPRSGCTLDGPTFAGVAELALDPEGAATFGDVRGARKTTLHFGDGSDGAVTAHFDVAGFALDVFARSLSLYLTARTVYQGVYEPYARTLLQTRASSATALRIEPDAWHGKDPPVFETKTPWTVPCARVGLVQASFEVPLAEKNLGLAYPLRDAIVLAAQPGGPPIVRLPPRTTVALLRVDGADAYVEWASDHGRYRGFVKRKDIDLGAGGVGQGYGTGYGRGSTSCGVTSLLYVVHDSGTAHLVGSVAPRTPIAFLPLAESRPPAVDEGKLTFVQPPAMLKLRPGYRLAIATAPAGSCRARPADQP